MSAFSPITTAFLAVASVAYLVLSARVSRHGPLYSDHLGGFLLLLIAGLLAGSAFSYGTNDVDFYGIGQTLIFFSTGFIPVVFYLIYRGYTVGPPNALTVIVLCIVPLSTSMLALTNSMHHILWVANETANGLIASNASDHRWYQTVHAPFSYGLYAYSSMALMGRLPSIAPAYRKSITVLLACAVLPFTIGIATTFLGVGTPGFPFTPISLALLWPVFAYASLKLQAHEFNPVAYQTLFDNVRDPIFVVDTGQRIICANKAAEQLLGGAQVDLLGRKLWEDFPEACAVLEQAKELDLTQTLRMNSNNVYEVSVGPLCGPKGQNLGMVIVCRDVTERRAVLNQLAESEHLIRTLIETSSNGMLRFARDAGDPEKGFRCVFSNRAAEGFVGNGAETLVGMRLDQMQQLNPEELSAHFSSGEQLVSKVSFEVASRSGHDEHWLRIVGEPVGDDFSVTLIDITKRKHNENKMLADALRDPLTGILNRRGFEKEAASCIRDNAVGAVLYLDLNHFKLINDRYGHQTGDALLKAFSHRLEFCLRPEDILGRLGGDEFAIVLPGVPIGDVKHIAGRLVQSASEAYILQGQEITCSASVGIALMPQHGEELWHLLSVADRAMYNTKGISEEEAANDRAAYIDKATAS